VHHYSQDYHNKGRRLLTMEAPQIIQPLSEGNNKTNKTRKTSDTPSDDSGVADLSTYSSPNLPAIDFSDEAIIPDIPISEPATPESYPDEFGLSTIFEEGSKETEHHQSEDRPTIDDKRECPTSSNNLLEKRAFIKRLTAYINKYRATRNEKQEAEKARLKARLAELMLDFEAPSPAVQPRPARPARPAVQFWNKTIAYVTDDETASYNERERYESSFDRMTGSMIMYIHDLQDCVVDFFASGKDKGAEKREKKESENLKLKRVKASASSHTENIK